MGNLRKINKMLSKLILALFAIATTLDGARAGQNFRRKNYGCQYL